MKLALLFLFLLAAPAFARLGETLGECEARYGMPVKTDTDLKRDLPIYEFHKDGISIRVWISDNRSVVETFGRSDGKLGDVFIADMLAGSAQGSSWVATFNGDAITYSRADGKAIANYILFRSLNSDVLAISTAEYGTGF